MYPKHPRMKRFSFILFLFFCFNNLYAQKDTIKTRFFFSSGIGSVYSFFSKGDPPFENNAGEYSSVDKKFGRAIDFEIGYQAALADGLEMKLSLIRSDNFGNRAGEVDSGGAIAFTFNF